MKLRFKRTIRLVAGLSFLLTIAGTTSAQEDTTPKKRLRSPAVIKGNIGGESHQSYVIYAQKGKLLNVEISWMPEGDKLWIANNHLCVTG